jgi:hypothetical protein
MILIIGSPWSHVKICICELIGRLARKTDLILNEELDTLHRSGASLRNGGGDAAYYCRTLLVCSL